MSKTRSDHSWAPLLLAAEKGYEEVVKLLPDKGVDVNTQGGQFGNALEAASFGGHERVLKLLLEKGANVHAEGGYFGNAFQAASAGGYKQVVKLLLNEGANINAQGGQFMNLREEKYIMMCLQVEISLQHGAYIRKSGTASLFLQSSTTFAQRIIHTMLKRLSHRT